MTVYNFGSINIDYVYRVHHLVNPGETIPSLTLETVLGGKGANQSVALARAGARVSHVGRVGLSDQWAIEALHVAGVDTTHTQCVDQASGHAIIQVDEQGENAIVLHGGANQSFDRNSLLAMLEQAEKGDWLLIQNECNALSHVFEIAKNKQLKLAFNPAPMTAGVSELPLALCNVLILNEVEARTLVKAQGNVISNEAEIMQLLSKTYPNTQIVFTLGARGAVLMHGDQRFEVKAPTVTAIDTTGAGDTFVGYVLAGLIDGHPTAEALHKACAAGALSVTAAGATPSIPMNNDVDSFLKSAKYV